MRRIPLLLSFVAIAAVAGAGDLKPFAVAFYAKLDKAQLNKDVPAFEKAARPVITADFVEIDKKGGKKTFTDSLAVLKDAFTHIDKVTVSTTKILKVEKKGGNTVLTVNGELQATVKGPDGAVHKLRILSSNLDTWKLVGKQWRYASSRELSEKTYFDGKLFDGA